MIGRNNPLNIRYNPCNKWLGQCGCTRGFCNFRSIEFGLRAVVKILVSYRNRGLRTYSDIITAWAPPSENKTSNYIKYVCDKCKVFPWDIPNDIESFSTLIYYMWCFEQGKHPTLTIAEIESIIDNFKFLNCYDEKS